MSELKLFYKEDGRIKMSRNIDLLKSIPLSQFIWIDLNDVNEEVEEQLEEFLKIYIQEEEEIEEIELSARYMQTEDTIVANSHFMQDDYSMEPVSFILKTTSSSRFVMTICGHFTKRYVVSMRIPASIPRVIMSLLRCLRRE